MLKKLYVPILLWLCGMALIACSPILAVNTVKTGEMRAVVWIFLVAGIAVFFAGFYELRRILKELRSSEDTPDASAAPERAPPEYRKKRAMLTKPEWEFYRLLKDFLSPEAFDILPQSALVSVVDKLTQTGYRNELFRIADFCIADAATTEPLLLIELNDASHLRSERVERDRRVAEICARAGMPLVTFTLQEAADTGLVRKTLKRYL